MGKSCMYVKPHFQHKKKKAMTIVSCAKCSLIPKLISSYEKEPGYKATHDVDIMGGITTDKLKLLV